MTETGIVALVGIIATFVGTLGATALANLNAARQMRTTRRFEIQDTARQLVVSILMEAKAWQASASAMGLVAAAADRLQELDDYLKNEYVDSWTGKQMVEHGEKLTASITEAKLLISDRLLRAEIEKLRYAHSHWWEEVLEPIREMHKSGNGDKVDRMRPVSQFDATFNRLLFQIELFATLSIASNIREEPSRVSRWMARAKIRETRKHGSWMVDNSAPASPGPDTR